MPVSYHSLRLPIRIIYALVRDSISGVKQRIGSRFFVYLLNTTDAMTRKQPRRISSAKIHKLFTYLSDQICSQQQHVTVSMSGNTFEIHLEGGSINITINEEKGGEA